MKYKLFLDLDGVIVDFDKQFEKYSNGIPTREFENKYGTKAFWELIENGGIEYWTTMEYMKDGKSLLNFAQQNFNPSFLSSPSRSELAKIGKKEWGTKNHPDIKLYLKGSKFKQEFAERSLQWGYMPILVDDRKDNIERWNAVGGIGIHHTSASKTIKELQKLLK